MFSQLVVINEFLGAILSEKKTCYMFITNVSSLCNRYNYKFSNGGLIVIVKGLADTVGHVFISAYFMVIWLLFIKYALMSLCF